MVDVRTKRLSNVFRRPVPGRHVTNNVKTSACTKVNADLIDDSRIQVRKRSRGTLDENSLHVALVALKRGSLKLPG